LIEFYVCLALNTLPLPIYQY